MPFPGDPQSRATLVNQDGTPAPYWARWLTELYRTVVPTGPNRVLYIPAVSGVPTFTPESRGGFVPLAYDTANDDLYVYNAGWVKVTLA